MSLMRTGSKCEDEISETNHTFVTGFKVALLVTTLAKVVLNIGVAMFGAQVQVKVLLGSPYKVKHQ